MTSIVHVINDLDRGGAETVLYRLLAGSEGRMDPIVISLTDEGVIGREIRALGIPVQHLGVNSSAGYTTGIARLRSRLRSLRPDLVQTWMYHADLVGGLAAKTSGVPATVWGIHATLRPKERSALLYRSGLAAAARLSRVVPDKIVCCSHHAAADHQRVGYDPAKLVVIPNGFEQQPTVATDSTLRDRLGLAPATSIVGSVGRLHPDKDHATFLEAANVVRSRRADVHFVLVGEGLDRTNEELMALVHGLGLGRHVSLLGPTSEVFDLYPQMDVVVCSSVIEALPLALGEAMAVGIPVVTTDVGDAARMVADPSRVVPVRSPGLLADAIEGVLSLSVDERRALGARDRDTILSGYGLSKMVDSYLRLYSELTS